MLVSRLSGCGNSGWEDHGLALSLAAPAAVSRDVGLPTIVFGYEKKPDMTLQMGLSSLQGRHFFYRCADLFLFALILTELRIEVRKGSSEGNCLLSGWLWKGFTEHITDLFITDLC